MKMKKKKKKVKENPKRRGVLLPIAKVLKGHPKKVKVKVKLMSLREKVIILKVGKKLQKLRKKINNI